MSQAFKASEALRRTFDVLATRFPTFAGLVLLVQSPLLLLRLAWSSSPPTTAEGRLAVAMLELGGEFVTGALASAAVVYGVFQTLRGAPVSFGECLRQGLRSLLAVLGVSFAVGLAIGGALLIALLLPIFVVVCVPVAVVLWIQLYVAVPAAVMERLGVAFSLSRSQELTLGRRPQVFGIVLFVVLAFFVPGFALGLLLAGFPAVLHIASAILGVVAATFAAVAASVVYHDLRVDKDGMATEDLAAVFD
ncbi:MAG: hypothetical protein H6744_05950 [Deltaproteobacteria bacterium]|nr:hypothetical protein [Deltaproteobacteria bacterium]MCB9786221.1 hypothetical protein [Deltaproteobacteria bacterium]